LAVTKFASASFALGLHGGANSRPADGSRSQSHFSFTNKGETPVEILEIRPPADCTAASTAKKVIQPSEQGTIDVTFKIGDRKGYQEKMVTVKTNEKDRSQTVLLLKVDIPDIVKVNKERLTWEIGDPLEEQCFEITNLTNTNLKVSSVRSLTSAFNVRLEEVAANKLYKVYVTPTGTDKPQRGLVRAEISGTAINRSIYLQALVE